MDLLEDDDIKGDNYDFTINQKFAKSFEAKSRLKELQKLKEISDESDSQSDSETEDEDAELLSPNLNLKIVETINSIRRKDPRIYEKSVQWFDKDQNEEKSVELSTKDEQKHKKKTFKDVLRDQLLEYGSDVDDENENLTSKKSMKINLAYDAEQRQIRDEFLKLIDTPHQNQIDRDDNRETDQDDNNELLSLKKSNRPKEIHEKSLSNALQEMKQLGNDSTDAEKDAFLSDFIIGKKWIDRLTNQHNNAADDDAMNDDNDERDLDKMDQFESKYNFRFEEIDNELNNETNIIGGNLFTSQVGL
jgi:protein KRI1